MGCEKTSNWLELSERGVMARPKKGAMDSTVEESVERTFWNMLESRRLNQVNVSTLIRETGINRSTFYYYYKDIDDLARRAVARNLPEQLPRIALLLFSGDVSRAVVDAQALHGIKKICLLIGHGGSRRISRLVEDALIQMWTCEFGLENIPADGEVMHTLEFLAGGVVSVLGRYGYPFDLEALERCIRAMNTVYTAPTLEFLTARTKPSPNKRISKLAFEKSQTAR
jgi:AcrR family transcriptional regulator